MHELSTRATNLSLHVHGLHAKMESTQDQLKLHRGQMAQWEEQKAHLMNFQHLPQKMPLRDHCLPFVHPTKYQYWFHSTSFGDP